MSTYTNNDLISAGYSYQELINANITPPFPDDSVYIQRRARSIFNIPLNRNTVESPYTNTGFTKAELDMRRKMEILKYNTGSNSSKLTKSEKLAQLVRGNYSSQRMSIPGDALVQMSSATAGIPGKPIPLELNPNVPLYGFKSALTLPGTAMEYVEPLPEWSVIYDENVVCLPSLYGNITKLSTLYIRPTIKSPYYTYRYKTPCSLNIAGLYLPNDTSGCTITVEIASITVNAYYNETLVNNRVLTSSTITTNTVVFELTPNADPTSDTYNCSLSINLGELDVENIFLYTEPNFVYSFRVSYQANFTITQPDSSLEYDGSITNADLKKRLQARLICNPDITVISNNPTVSNCLLTTTQPNLTYENSLNIT
jgi:hypothetical protein